MDIGKIVKPGFVYDEIMTRHCDPRDADHVEKPLRITYVYDVLKMSGILNGFESIPLRTATDDELNLVHEQKYISEVKGYRSSDSSYQCDLPETWPSYVCDHTYQSAACAVGGCLSLADALLTNKVRNGLAVVRPPGHHAEMDKSHGFCYFNNVAITARYLLNNYSERIRKILILDWDIHHGNGTQHAFYDDNAVLYISLHRYDHGRYYPHLPEGDVHAVGRGKGEGYNVNIPWNDEKMGNAEYLAAFQRVVVPITKQYKPDILLVSAGFDAAQDDPLGEYNVTCDAYGHMTSTLMELTNRRLVFILEGGYNLESMASCVLSVMEALTDKITKTNTGFDNLDLCPSADETLHRVISEQRKYWQI